LATGASSSATPRPGISGRRRLTSGRRRGLAVTVEAARSANPLKLSQIAASGADVRVDGEDARLLARELAQARRAYLVEDTRLGPGDLRGRRLAQQAAGNAAFAQTWATSLVRATCPRRSVATDRDWHCRPCGEIIEPLMVRATAS
jgi:hypothetical protein